MRASDPFGFVGAINFPKDKKTVDKVHNVLFKKKIEDTPALCPICFNMRANDKEVERCIAKHKRNKNE